MHAFALLRMTMAYGIIHKVLCVDRNSRGDTETAGRMTRMTAVRDTPRNGCVITGSGSRKRGTSTLVNG